MISNRFLCDSTLQQISYFRGSPEGVAYVGIWRQVSEDHFMLKHRIKIPEAPIGIQRIVLPEPLPVERGDFLGIHYPKNTSEGIIVHSIPLDNAIPQSEMFQTLVVDVYDGDLPTDHMVDMRRYSQYVESKTFALLGYLGVDLGPG